MSRLTEINGKKVKDANFRMAVHVTPEDVKKGNRKDASSCAIALACMRDLDALSASVNLTRTYVEYPKRWLRFITPKQVRDQIADFDTKGKFKPGTIILMPPAPSEKVGVPIKRTPKEHRKTRAPRKITKGVRPMASIHHQAAK